MLDHSSVIALAVHPMQANYVPNPFVTESLIAGLGSPHCLIQKLAQPPFLQQEAIAPQVGAEPLPMSAF